MATGGQVVRLRSRHPGKSQIARHIIAPMIIASLKHEKDEDNAGEKIRK
jgi:hypothetical protein